MERNETEVRPFQGECPTFPQKDWGKPRKFELGLPLYQPLLEFGTSRI